MSLSFIIGNVLFKEIRHYGLEKRVIHEDKKGIFQNLYKKFIEEQPEQNEELEALIYELYPELKMKLKHLLNLNSSYTQ